MQCDFPEENRASMTDQHNNFIQIYFRQQVGLLYGLGAPYRMKENERLPKCFLGDWLTSLPTLPLFLSVFLVWFPHLDVFY